MKAAVFDQYQAPLNIQQVPDPVPHSDSAIIQVAACGICRSDWHGWMGHDADVQPPHVPGHELSGTIAAVGRQVEGWSPDQRITVPFTCGCGNCRECRSGNHQICDSYTQPGVTHWGAFAEYVEVRHADVNLVGLPNTVDFVTAASLGCRFATAFRAIMDQGSVKCSETVAVHGCGGVGLSAVMIAAAAGARVIAVDIAEQPLALARECGADELINAGEVDTVEAIRQLTSGGVAVSSDALGSRTTCFNSVRCLRKRGRHVQIGLTLGADTDPPIPMGDVIAGELRVIGSHGMSVADYPRMIEMIERGTLNPGLLVNRLVTLEEGAVLLPKMDEFPCRGVSVIDMTA